VNYINGPRHRSRLPRAMILTSAGRRSIAAPSAAVPQASVRQLIGSVNNLTDARPKLATAHDPSKGYFIGKPWSNWVTRRFQVSDAPAR
jgi:hypothetical protein